MEIFGIATGCYSISSFVKEGKMSNESSTSSGGIGVLGLLGCIFVTLKLCGVINWSWWWVTAPFWGGFLLFLLILMFAFVASFVAFVVAFVVLYLVPLYLERKERKKR